MALVAGVDFGTLSVRVTLVDSKPRADRRHTSASYPLNRRRRRPRTLHDYSHTPIR